jgi:hypothetical protein
MGTNLQKHGGNIMKKLSVLLALLALFFTDFALAGAVITALTGSAQVQTGTATPRTLRTGDEVNQGDNVSTGQNSSLVMKFDDGQVVALTSNSRMTVTTYQYNAGAESGNVLLSLITGGMRTITGLIGRRDPSKVAYRAATATIGIRGTDGTIVTDGTNFVVTVTEGTLIVRVNGSDYLVSAGRSLYIRSNGPPVSGTHAEVNAVLPSNFASAVTQSFSLSTVISNTAPGTPRQEAGHDAVTITTGTSGGIQGGASGGAGGGGNTTPSGS